MKVAYQINQPIMKQNHSLMQDLTYLRSQLKYFEKQSDSHLNRITELGIELNEEEEKLMLLLQRIEQIKCKIHLYRVKYN